MAPEPTSTLASIIKDYGPPVAWLVAAYGLYFNNVAANTREKRKEFRAEIDAIEKVSKEAVTKLNAYFKLEERTLEGRNLEVEIKVQFREIGLKWDRLKKRQTGGDLGLFVDPCEDALDAFYTKATGAYFETEDRLPAAERQNHLHEIHVSSLLFVEALHSLFLKKFDKI